MSKLLNSGQIGNIGLEHMKKIRQQTQEKWGGLGFLDGLSGHVKENIAQLYECCASSLLPSDTEFTGKTDLEVYEKEGQIKK